MFFCEKFGNAFAYFVVWCLLARWRYHSKLLTKQNIVRPKLYCRPNCALQVLVGKKKYILTQESFCLQGILNDIKEHNTSFLECKHKHVMKSGAPSDKVGVLCLLLPIELHGFTSRIDL